MILPANFDQVAAPDVVETPSTSSASDISINQASSETLSSKKDKSVKSSLAPAAMVRFLSTKPIQAYDKDENFLGLHNPTRKTNMAVFLPCNSELSDVDVFDCTPPILTHYTVSQRSLRKQHRSLVNRGANGGISGSDVRWIGGCSPPVHVSVTDIGSHRINDFKVGTVGGVLSTHLGVVIGIFNNYAHAGDGHSIHSCIQLEHLCNQVDDRHPSLGGKATIITNDGYVTPLSFVSGLPYLDI